MVRLFQEAEEYYKLAVKLDPERVDAHFYLGEADALSTHNECKGFLWHGGLPRGLLLASLPGEPRKHVCVLPPGNNTTCKHDTQDLQRTRFRLSGIRGSSSAGQHFRLSGDFQTAYDHLSTAVALPYPPRSLFQWQMLYHCLVINPCIKRNLREACAAA